MLKEPQLLNYVTINTTGESRRGAGGLRKLSPTVSCRVYVSDPLTEGNTVLELG
jgi:hypothetical protein